MNLSERNYFHLVGEDVSAKKFEELEVYIFCANPSYLKAYK